ncbi:MAG: FTR1 family iron permease [Treponema sp.]|uniref:FTR1 family iron permease n=1 Tax=Treponema sp. TaxID=166 RepID=UPI0025D1882F|nr:FTR1 family protein [Treponema sp.]MBQ8678767.1 FTR1 family iron permease [Treponema sp.]MBQ8681241.1 FTR1 family iron permease [Treponema sp.]
MRKFLLAFVITFSVLFGVAAADKSWKSVATEMQGIIDDAYSIYAGGNADGGYERMNDAYFGHYEVDGFERNTQSRIGGSRAGNVEVQFSRVKTAMRAGKPNEEVRKEADTLIAMLFEDAEKLDPPDMSWTELAQILQSEFGEAAGMYSDGKVVTAEPKFRKAYARYYGKSKFQENVAKSLGSARDEQIVNLYTKTKSMILNKEAKPAVVASITELSDLLSVTAADLTKKQGRAQWWATVVASLLILLREGFEAILIVGAIIAYLRKSGNEGNLPTVYKGSVIGILASIVMALILIGLTRFGFESGQGQEVVEGVTMFIAVAVLFYTSNWMLSKASSKAWSNYLKGKIQTSVDSRSMFSLAFTCFLAVFREGAEVILFYQAMFSGSDGNGTVSAVILGMIIAVVLLVFVYKAIILTGKKLPLKPFFMATSILMFVMVVAFVGGGISEFVDAAWIQPKLVDGVPTISLLGIYPYAQSLIAQGIAIAVIVATLILGKALSGKKEKE